MICLHALKVIIILHSPFSILNFSDALEADVLWHLRVSVLAVEERGIERLHVVNHVLVRVFLGRRQVLLVAEELVGVE